MTLAQILENLLNSCQRRGQVLFRGQPEDKPLLPKLQRNRVPSETWEVEREMLATFKLRARPHLKETAVEHVELMAIAQHEGMATRLLDWSDSPLVALWFAVKDLSISRLPGVLWAFRVPQEAQEPGHIDADKPRVFVYRPAC
jgi:hypothetical protein